MSTLNALTIEINRLKSTITNLKKMQKNPPPDLTPIDPIDPIDPIGPIDSLDPQPIIKQTNNNEPKDYISDLSDREQSDIRRFVPDEAQKSVRNLTNNPQYVNSIGRVINHLESTLKSLSGMSNSLDATTSGLQSTISQQNNQISNLSRDAGNKDTQIINLTDQKLNLGETIFYQDQDIKQLKKTDKEKQVKINQLNGEINNAKKVRDKANNAASIAIADKDKLLARLKPLEKEIKQLEVNINKLKKELSTSVEALPEAEKMLYQLKEELKKIKEKYAKSVTDLKNEFALQHESLVEKHKAFKSDLAKKLEAIESATKVQLSLEKFIKQTNENLAKVQQSLRDANGSYHLGVIDMALKVLPSMALNKNSVSLPQLSDLKTIGSDHFSTINLQFLPDQKISDKSTDNPEPSNKVMPDLLQQTVTYASRQIKQLGLESHIFQKAIETEEMAGRVLHQKPSRLAEYPQDGVVNLWIGKYVPPISQLP